MPVTDFGNAGNNNDWLQSLLAAFGAGQPASSPSPLLRAGGADSLPLAFGNVTSQDYQNWLAQQGGGAAPSPGPAPSSPGPAPPGVGGPYVGSGPPGMPGPAPAGVGGPYVGGQGPAPIDRNHPLPWRAPTGTGGQGQAPSAPSPVNNRFQTVQYQVPTGRGPLSGNPIYTTLNLADLFKRKS